MFNEILITYATFQCQLLEKKLGDSQLFFEFEKIPKQKKNCDFTTATLPENIPRNR